MKNPTVIVITRNQSKLDAAKAVFNKFGINLENTDKEYPEIQADTSLEIARFTAIQAAKELKKPVIREDHSLFLNALNIPGPYTAYIEKRISAEKLLSLLKNQKDRTGYFEIATVYAEPSGLVKEFVYQVPIYIKNKEKVKDPKGGWNGILCLKGEPRAFTEYPEQTRLHAWNKNYLSIAEFLKRRGIS